MCWVGGGGLEGTEREIRSEGREEGEKSRRERCGKGKGGIKGRKN